MGGSTEIAHVLVTAEATNIRTLLNLEDLAEAFEDPQRRPKAAATPILGSYHYYLNDWIEDSGELGDKYDSELAALFEQTAAGVRLDPQLMQQILDRLVALEPGLPQYLVNNPDGLDFILLEFPVYIQDAEAIRTLQDEVEALWLGNDDAITVTSNTMRTTSIRDQITSRQTESITSTVAVALAILCVFFWVTLRQPVLGVVAVGPIVLVLICVLGTMALLNIPYSLATSIITALSIGIGVDYTIHIVHRYREEFAHMRNPERAALRTLSTTGSALLGSALTTALGFGVLITSPILASQQFGITATITIVYSLVVAIIVVLPAMVVWGAYQNMSLRSTVEQMWEDLDVAIEEVHRQYDEEENGA